MARHALCSALLLAFAGTATAGSFTYRGQLVDDGQPATGRYDLQFTLYADRDGRQRLAGPLERQDVRVADGVFAVALDLPETLAASGWLEVAIRPVDEHAWWPLGDKEAVALKAAMCPAAWELGGNAGTVPGSNFLGTTDNQSFEVRTANTRSLRIEPSDVTLNGAAITSNFIAGSSVNEVTSGVRGATIAGGGLPSGNSDPAVGGEAPNRITDHFGFIGGGLGNLVGNDSGSLTDGAFATVGGGRNNSASGVASAVLGGLTNRATGLSSLVASGEGNTASGSHASVLTGILNQASGQSSVVVAGNNNRAAGEDSIVLGGFSNCAGGDRSLAAGTRAKVLPATDPGGSSNACANQTGYSGTAHHGTFVWADSVDASFVSSGPNQFLIRSQGGVAINSQPISGAVELSITADPDDSDFANLFLRQRANNAGILISAGGATATNDNNAGFFLDHFNGAGAQARRLALNSDGSVQIRSNITAANTGVSMAAGSGAWSALSDRSVKTAVVAVDPASILDGVLRLPISEWSYIAQGEGIRHLGPMAQDFAAAFGLGENATTISSIDADGVALAAIQGLNAKLESENAALRGELAELRRMVEALRPAGSR